MIKGFKDKSDFLKALEIKAQCKSSKEICEHNVNTHEEIFRALLNFLIASVFFLILRKTKTKKTPIQSKFSWELRRRQHTT